VRDGRRRRLDRCGGGGRHRGQKEADEEQERGEDRRPEGPTGGPAGARRGAGPHEAASSDSKKATWSATIRSTEK